MTPGGDPPEPSLPFGKVDSLFGRVENHEVEALDSRETPSSAPAASSRSTRSTRTTICRPPDDNDGSVSIGEHDTRDRCLLPGHERDVPAKRHETDGLPQPILSVP